MKVTAKVVVISYFGFWIIKGSYYIICFSYILLVVLWTIVKIISQWDFLFYNHKSLLLSHDSRTAQVTICFCSHYNSTWQFCSPDYDLQIQGHNPSKDFPPRKAPKFLYRPNKTQTGPWSFPFLGFHHQRWIFALKLFSPHPSYH